MPTGPQAAAWAGAPPTASVSVVVPAPGPGVLLPQSIAISVLQVNGTPAAAKQQPYTMNLSAAVRGCKPLAGGALSCTVTVPAPAGSVVFALSTYSGTNGTGRLIATSQAKTTVTSGTQPKCAPGSNVVSGPAV